MAGTSLAKDEKHSDPKRGCVTSECHVKVVKHAFLHGPLAVDQCMVCHQAKPGPEHHFQIAKTGTDLCLNCHDPLPEYAFPHEPVQKGKCLDCHDPHGGTIKRLLRQPTASALCLDCHKKFELKKYRHGPIEKSGCTGCHDVHGGMNAKLTKGTGQAFCLSCHKTLDANLKKYKKPHEPVLKKCGDCHETHSSAFEGLLKKSWPDLCKDCHKEIFEPKEGVWEKHKKLLEEVECKKCHDPHVSPNLKLLKGAQSALCQTCHDKLKASTAGAVSTHEPYGKGECTKCHQVHQHLYPKGLRKNFNDANYVKYQPKEFEFCFDCHKVGLVENEHTMADTAFRNGDTNLHYVHVKKDARGRGCAMCHEPHAAKQLHLLKPTFKFGNWEVPLTFVATPNGGKCTSGCHKVYEYNRVTPQKFETD